MSDNLKQQVIHHLAEEGVSTVDDPWEAVKAKLAHQPASQQPKRALAWAMAALVILALGAAFFLTRPGRAAAQNFIQLFRRAERNVLPLPPGLPVEPIPPTRTPAPTQVIGLELAATGTSRAIFTPTPIKSTEQGPVTAGLTIAEAEALAGFPVRVPNSLPDGYRLANTTFDSERQLVTQIYQFTPYQAGEMFILHQQLEPPTDPIGLSAEIEQFAVGSTAVEAVSGSWFVAAGSNQEEWIPDAPVHTFRWVQQGITITLQFVVGDTFSPAYLTREAMLAVVETVIGTRSTLPETVELNNLPSVEAAEQAAGFDLLAPTLLPEGFVLERAVYEPENKRAVFIYITNDSSGKSSPSLVIYQIAKDSDTPAANTDGAEAVMVGGYPGVLFDGEVPSLFWETDSLSITINYFGDPSHPARIEKARLVEIGEGMK